MPKFSAETIRAYLLGILVDGRDLLEECLMTDDRVFESVQAEEEEMIQEYVDGELPENDLQRFESHYLNSAERRRRVDFARNLRKIVDQKKSTDDTHRSFEPV